MKTKLPEPEIITCKGKAVSVILPIETYKEMLERLEDADVSDEGMAIRPEDEIEASEASLVDRDGFLVFTGTERFDAVQVIMAARADREDDISSRRTP